MCDVTNSFQGEQGNVSNFAEMEIPTKYPHLNQKYLSFPEAKPSQAAKNSKNSTQI